MTVLRQRPKKQVSPPALNHNWLLWLFIAFCCLYLLTSGGHFYASDDVQKFRALEVFLQTGHVSFLEGWAIGTGGLHYSWFPGGASLLMLPGWLIGHALAGFVPQLPSEFCVRFFITLQNAIVTAGLVTLLAAYARWLGHRPRAATFSAVAFGLGTMAWPYAKTAWSEPGATLAAFAACFALQAASRENFKRPKVVVIAGICLAIAISIRQELALFMPGALAWCLWRHRGDWRPLFRACAVIALPIAIAGGLALWYNQLRYGHWLSFVNYQSVQSSLQFPPGGRPVWALVNMWHYTLNPGDGLLWFSPALWLGIWGLASFWKAQRETVWLFLATLAPLFLFYTAGWGLSDWAWGLRYAYIFQPFLMLPAAAVWQARPQLKNLLAVAAGVCVAFQLVAVLHNFNFLYERERAGNPGLSVQQMLAEPAHSPLLQALTATPATLKGGVALVFEAQPPEPLSVAAIRSRAQFVPDLWPFLLLLTRLPRWGTAMILLTLAIGLVEAIVQFLKTFEQLDALDSGVSTGSDNSSPPLAV
jgi:hypothetical protein